MGVPMYAHRELMALRLPIFTNIEALYEQEGGATSKETDFGVDWCLSESGAVARHRFRVSHIDETNVVYAVALSFTPLAVMLARGVPYDEAEYALQGWENHANPSLFWASQKLAQWSPIHTDTAPMFEDDVSPLTGTNDGRVRMTTVGQEIGVYGLVIDGVLTWRTKDRVAVDAFIAGWDARDGS